MSAVDSKHSSISIYKPFFGALNLPCATLFQEKYGAGEPSVNMVEAIYKDVHGSYKRIIAIAAVLSSAFQSFSLSSIPRRC